MLSFFFFNDTSATEIYTLSLHDALPILDRGARGSTPARRGRLTEDVQRLELIGLKSRRGSVPRDRKSTRLNSSHLGISYAVFCLKKKKRKKTQRNNTTQELHEKDRSAQH